MYGAQTVITRTHTDFVFENDVEMYGAQTALFVPEDGFLV